LGITSRIVWQKVGRSDNRLQKWSDLNSSIFYIQPTVLSPQIAFFHRCIRMAIDLVHYYELDQHYSSYYL
jgi:hypothetical protein